jgi:aspartyl/asparaginyl beta-hydroxylase (cupin superfamily)
VSEIISYLKDDVISIYKDYLLNIKNNYNVIKEELKNIPLSEYTHPPMIPYENGNVWKIYMVKKQNIKEDKKNYAPKTFKALSDNIYYNVVFSLLTSNTNVNLHRDILNFLYRSHLGLDVPEEYKFICNNIDITTNNGEINFFDLTDEHEAINSSNKDRIVLLVDLIKK